jgi:RNA polymerase sigma-70 factor (ECF subfamily)
VQERNYEAHFEQAVLPHLDAAYNLARWLMRNDQDAEDMVQEACLRALRFFGGYRGTDGRAWLLTIVRNTCYSWLRHHRAHDLMTPFDEDAHSAAGESSDPEALSQRHVEAELLSQAVEALPVEFREVIVLRELEGLSYKQIALIADVPIGTVMSRLARARRRLHECLVAAEEGGTW